MSELRIELLSHPGCANVNAARQLLRACLAELGISTVVTEREGELPSPTILVNGADVMGHIAGDAAACRLDVPTRERVLAALQRAAA